MSKRKKKPVTKPRKTTRKRKNPVSEPYRLVQISPKTWGIYASPANVVVAKGTYTAMQRKIKSIRAVALPARGTPERYALSLAQDREEARRKKNPKVKGGKKVVGRVGAKAHRGFTIMGHKRAASSRGLIVAPFALGDKKAKSPKKKNPRKNPHPMYSRLGPAVRRGSIRRPTRAAMVGRGGSVPVERALVGIPVGGANQYLRLEGLRSNPKPHKNPKLRKNHHLKVGTKVTGPFGAGVVERSLDADNYVVRYKRGPRITAGHALKPRK